MQETEKLKMELSDLKKIVRLQKQIEDKETDIASNMPVNSIQESNLKDKQKIDLTFRCKKCNFETNFEQALESHMDLKHTEYIENENQFKCYKCDFKGKTASNLKSHIEDTHSSLTSVDNEIKCRNCDIKFNEKWNLMKHRKEAHSMTVGTCKKFIAKTCPFTSSACWWRHDNSKDDRSNFSCYICEKTFVSRTEMMIHRKKYHIDMVPRCNQFEKGSCKFQSEFCWFKHVEAVNEHLNVRDTTKDSDAKLDFQKVTKNHDPTSA